jgi:hypothetical protein
MPYLPNEEDCNLAAQPSDGKDGEIDTVDIAELFASPPPTLGELFADPVVSMRIGMLITRATNKPQPRRRDKPR